MRANQLLSDAQSQFELPDGTVIRKGTIGAFLVNARTWSDPASDDAQRVSAEHDMLEALPALRALGLFEVLAVRDEALRQWIEQH